MDGLIRRRGERLLTDVRPVTPVDTGTMVGNWRLRYHTRQRRTVSVDLVNDARSPQGYPYPPIVIERADSAEGLRRVLRDAGFA